MKKFIKFIFVLLVCATACCLIPKENNFSYAADASADAINNSALGAVTITQDGYVFSGKDFEVTKNGSQTVYNLYVNTAITLWAPQTGTAGITWQKVNAASDVIKNVALPTDAAYMQCEYDGTELKRTMITITYNPGILGAQASTFTFYLIQTPDHFATSPSFNWMDEINSDIPAPIIAGYYKNFLKLKNLKDTTATTYPVFENANNYNKVFIDFYFNGEFYSIYTNNNSSIFYSTLTDNRIEETEIKFDQAGEYEVYIYDYTAYSMLKEVTIANNTYKIFDKTNTDGSKYANVVSFKFKLSLSDTQNNMIILAKDDENNTIVNSQKINANVNIQFQNLDASSISEIRVVRSYDKENGGHEQEITNLLNSYKISVLNETTLVYNQDGNYTITIYDKHRQSIKSFNFEILKSIYTNKENINKLNLKDYIDEKYLDQDGNPKSNIIYSIDRTKIINTHYNGFVEVLPGGTTTTLESSTTTNYIIQIAIPDTKIEGVVNGSKISEVPEVYVKGVGNINVTITKDNVTTSYVVRNGYKIDNIQDIGDYSIRITDQMGNTSSVSFSITKALNAATIVLIVIGAALLAIVIFLIIRVRTKIKVR